MHDYSRDEYELISRYFRLKNEKEGDTLPVIDDITWNDLDMDEFFHIFDNTCSQNGGEYLYDMLRRPLISGEEERDTLKERGRVSRFFKENPDIREKYRKALEGPGILEKTCFHEKLEALETVKQRGNGVHYAALVFGIVAIAAVFINPPLGFILFILASLFNVTAYFKRKAEIESFIPVFRYLIRQIRECRELLKLQVKELGAYRDRLEASLHTLKGMNRNSWIITTGKRLTGGILELPLDFIRIFFHPDLIKFNSMLSLALSEKTAIIELFDVTGFLDSMISVSLFMDERPALTEPVFREGGIEVINGYHPLLSDPVPYSIKDERLMLLTGSNASGKSTFLKSAALSMLLAETVYLVPADSFSCPRSFVITSMSVRDSITKGDSLYMAEIRSVKRIIERQKAGMHLAVFLDEVLRGTNTVERIASLSVLLKHMAQNSLVFAATHDTPLTYVLEDIYNNYHFEEEIRPDGISFPYELKEGRTESRDAIMLLSVMGFDKDITMEAYYLSDRFLEEGTWEKI